MAFVVIVSLGSYLEKDSELSRVVRVHQLYVDQEEITSFSQTKFVPSYNLPFESQSLTLNLAESALIVTSSSGVWICELPGYFINSEFHANQPLDEPSRDVDIKVNNYLDEEGLEVLQAEFSHLNKKNIYVLTRKQKEVVLHIINLEYVQVEVSYHLD